MRQKEGGSRGGWRFNVNMHMRLFLTVPLLFQRHPIHTHNIPRLWAGGDAASSYAVAAAAGTDAKLSEIKEKAQALADFAMSVGSDLSNDTLARLNRLQSMML